MSRGATLVIGTLKLAYGVFKLLPTQGCKVLFLSRQSDEMPLDYSLTIAELESRTELKEDGTLKTVFIGNRIKAGLASKISFAWALFRSLYHLATSKVVVLDSYWPAVSVLQHKPELLVVQIWHAMGKIKQSGRAAIGKPGGRDEAVAKAYKMHEGYDYVITGAPIWNEPCCSSFGVDDTQLVNIGLPRGDELYLRKAEMAARVYERYPELSPESPHYKPVVLYAPTFRRGGSDGYKELLAKVNLKRFIFILKAHPKQRLENISPHILELPEFSAFELLSVADYLITDYSAIAVEAAIANLKTLYYVYDYEDYIAGTGLNIDLFAEMPGLVFRTADEVLDALDLPYPQEKLDAYKERYLVSPLGRATRDLVDLLIEKGELCTHSSEN